MHSVEYFADESFNLASNAVTDSAIPHHGQNRYKHGCFGESASPAAQILTAVDLCQLIAAAICVFVVAFFRYGFHELWTRAMEIQICGAKTVVPDRLPVQVTGMHASAVVNPADHP